MLLGFAHAAPVVRFARLHEWCCASQTCGDDPEYRVSARCCVSVLVFYAYASSAEPQPDAELLEAGAAADETADELD